MRKLLIVVTILVLVIIAGGYIVLSKNTEQQNNSIAEDQYVTKEGYTFAENEQFGYRFQYKTEFIRESNPPVEIFKVLGGDFVHINPNLVKGYQLPGIDISVLDKSLLSNSSLEQWLSKVSTNNFDSLSSDNNLRYFATKSPLILKDDELIFFINEHPFLNGKTPALLIENDNYLIQIQSLYRPFDHFEDLISNFEYLRNDKYQKLERGDLEIIRNYFDNYENL